MKTCKECKWWEGDDNGVGVCHRYPPIEQIPEDKDYYGFPVTLMHYWCGEYEAK